MTWELDGDSYFDAKLWAVWWYGEPVRICRSEKIDGQKRYRWIRGDECVSCLDCATAQAIGLHMQYIRDKDSAEWAKAAIKQPAPKGKRVVSIEDRARAYLEKLPPSIQGSNGSHAMFYACQVLVRGYALSIDEALPIVLEYDARSDPAWGKQAVKAKLVDAKRHGRMKVGKFL